MKVHTILCNIRFNNTSFCTNITSYNWLDLWS